ncbi:hypothetical protein JYJ95_22830 [Corallococcus exiguus]|jgi:hypothetical protein|uniref:hypothetical protein n=1 Tax=Corallococcus exiguus TaxID=83462 RepID=UPI001A90533E|nr:hypothetical protein [Corallococcus exiguus]MBN8469346.1 hypothetical protein [Corallococcus exiguus]
MRQATKQAPMNLKHLNPSGHGIDAASRPSPVTAPSTCRWRDFASYRLASPGS